MSSNDFKFFLSSEFSIYLRAKIECIDGVLPERSISTLLDEPGISPGHLLQRLIIGDQGPVNEMYVSCQLFANGHPVGLPSSTSSHTSSHINIRWGDNLNLPVRYCDLTLDAQLVFTIYDIVSPHHIVVVGGTTLPLFTKSRKLRKGKRRLRIFLGVPGDGSVPTSTPGNDSTHDELHRFDKLQRKHARGGIPRVNWLDAMTFRAIEKIRAQRSPLWNEPYLVIDLPTFEHTVLFQDKVDTVQYNQTADNTLVLVQDPEFENENPIVVMHRKLLRSKRRNQDDRNARPDVENLRELNAILDTPPTQPLTSEQKDLIWQFRYYLQREKRALTKFLHSVAWNDPRESQHAVQLMDEWAEIDVDDALELLSSSFVDPRVRKHAVKRLSKAGDEQLLQYLLQLVQSLRYEAAGSTELQYFLIGRATVNPILASYLYWYLSVAAEDSGPGSLFSDIQSAFQYKLQESVAGAAVLVDIQNQEKLLARLHSMYRALALVGDRIKKIDRLREVLAQDFASFTACRLPLHPAIVVHGIEAGSAYIFKSAMQPLMLTFKCEGGGKYTVIYKNGDDLRQDQLIIQLITLMDSMLKKENLDLKLTPYRVLATSPLSGMVECVPHSYGLNGIREEHGTLHDFMFKYNAAPGASLRNKQVTAECSETFIRSCAGYSVITYLLGIGDRHLDNLMMTEKGHLFHIDFGYILGHDPKPYPPPMKIVKEMVEAMGPKGFLDFKKYCTEAFNILRKHANLIINLFVLMVDANIRNLASDKDRALLKLKDCFRMDLRNIEANTYIQGLIEESVNALMPKFMEAFHSIAQALRA